MSIFCRAAHQERQYFHSIFELNRYKTGHHLQNGWREKRKDQFDDFHKAWSYAIRGKTVDQRELRVIVSFDENPQMLIITLIDVTK